MHWSNFSSSRRTPTTVTSLHLCANFATLYSRSWEMTARYQYGHRNSRTHDTWTRTAKKPDSRTQSTTSKRRRCRFVVFRAEYRIYYETRYYNLWRRLFGPGLGSAKPEFADRWFWAYKDVGDGYVMSMRLSWYNRNWNWFVNVNRNLCACLAYTPEE